MSFGNYDTSPADNALQAIQNDPEIHKASHFHEAIALAASSLAMKAYLDREKKEGKVVNHAMAKELLFGLVGAEVDKFAESKGLDELAKLKAHHEAKEHAKLALHQSGMYEDTSYERQEFVAPDA